MEAVEHDFTTDDLHPIDIAETLAERRDWDFDRVADDRIALAVEGAWTTYSVTLAWSAHDETLRLICSWELAPPEERRAALAAALNLANERIFTGAFAHVGEDGLLVWRYGLVCAGGALAAPSQIDAMMRGAVAACERFHPAFQLVAFDGAEPEDAVEIAIDEAYGRA